MNDIPDVSESIRKLNDKLNELKDKNISITATVEVQASGGTVKNQTPNKNDKINLTRAKGNVALAGGRKQTLMGELGPELYVTGGHYYVAGQNGAEMVDLPEDAIVFNHL
jgi:hypothetical protein